VPGHGRVTVQRSHLNLRNHLVNIQ
jgi:hypothetical protein